jgi:uncharacterized protein (DUF486 family)
VTPENINRGLAVRLYQLLDRLVTQLIREIALLSDGIAFFEYFMEWYENREKSVKFDYWKEISVQHEENTELAR